MKKLILFLMIFFVGLAVAQEEQNKAEVKEIKMLDDFESVEKSMALWCAAGIDSTVDMELSKEHVTQGSASMKINFRKGVQYPWIKIIDLPLELKDWTKYKSLQFDIYNPHKDVFNWCLRIDDDKTDSYHNRMNMDDPGVLILPERVTHVELDIRKIAAMNGRYLEKDKIKLFAMGLEQQKADTYLFIDNLHLSTEKAKKMETKLLKTIFSEVDSQDPDLGKRRDSVETMLKAYKGLIETAQGKGLDTSYYEIYSLAAELALKKRLMPVWFDRRLIRTETLDWLDKNLKEASEGIKSEISGGKVNIKYPGYAAIEELTLKDGYFGINGEPKLFFSAGAPKGKLKTFFAKAYYYTTQAIGGKTRYNVDASELMKEYMKDEDMHRVGWSGFCGHLIRDGSSFSVKGPDIVICLESPKTQKIIKKTVMEAEKPYKGKKSYLMDAIGWELSYGCFCKYTQEMFREYLKSIHKDINNLNKVWGLKYNSFEDITVSMENIRETRAKWYDFANFNTLRFANLMKNAGSYVKGVDPDRLIGGGSPHLYFTSNFWKAEDGELTQGEYMDIAWCESSANTLQVDLVKSFTEGKKPIFDMEYHGDIAHMLLQYLHGMNGMDMWMWADTVASEANIPVLSFAQSNIAVSWEIPLDNQAKLLKDALDLRRFSKEISTFGRIPGQMGMFYSRTSVLQVPPQLTNSLFNPHIYELKKVYEAALKQDAYLRFVTEKQLAEGKAASLKLLVVSAAEFVTEPAAQKMIEFVKNGGSLVVTPNSMLGNEYAEKKDYLKDLGIIVGEIKAPTLEKKGSGQSGFIQEAQDEIAYTDLKKEKLAIVDKDLSKEAFEAVGVRQSIKAADGSILAKFEDGTAAIISVKCGKGNVYYTAMPLVERSMWKLLSYACSKAGLERPLRVKDAAGNSEMDQVEARLVKLDGKNIAYLFNSTNQPAKVLMELNGSAVKSVLNKRTGQTTSGASLEVPAKETLLLELF